MRLTYAYKPLWQEEFTSHPLWVHKFSCAIKTQLLSTYIYTYPTWWQEDRIHHPLVCINSSVQSKTQLLSKWINPWLRGIQWRHIMELYIIWMHKSYYAIQLALTHATQYMLRFQYLGTPLLEVIIQNDAEILGLLKVTHSLRCLLLVRKQWFRSSGTSK